MSIYFWATSVPVLPGPWASSAPLCGPDGTVLGPQQQHMDEAKLRDLFSLFDRDGSGSLDAEELLAILTRGDQGLSLADAQEIIKDFDDNKDGVLTVDEFIKAWAVVGGGGDGSAVAAPAAGDYVLFHGDFHTSPPHNPLRGVECNTFSYLTPEEADRYRRHSVLGKVGKIITVAPKGAQRPPGVETAVASDIFEILEDSPEMQAAKQRVE